MSKLMPNKNSTNHKKINTIVIFAPSIAALAGLLAGFDTGIISGALEFIANTFHLTTVGKETVVSIVLVGGVMGALLNGLLADSLGRKKMVVLAVPLWIHRISFSAWVALPTTPAFQLFMASIAINSISQRSNLQNLA